MANDNSKYDLPQGWTLRHPPKGVISPLDPEKSSSDKFRGPVLKELNRAGRTGLTVDRCGDIAYGGDKDRRGKQIAMINKCCDEDGHNLAFSLDRKRVALAKFFERPYTHAQ